jgi:hypothetical protein
MSIYLIGFFITFTITLIAITISNEKFTVGGVILAIILSFGSWYSIFLILLAILFSTTSIKDWDIWNMKIFN